MQKQKRNMADFVKKINKSYFYMKFGDQGKALAIMNLETRRIQFDTWVFSV